MIVPSSPGATGNESPQGSITQSLLILPSTYGLVAWLGALAALSISPYDYPFEIETWAIIAYTSFIFACSIGLWAGRAQQSTLYSNIIYSPFNDRLLLIVSTIIGGIGLALYVRDFSSFFGGVGSFFSTLTESSLSVRGAAQDVESAGFQVSYLSWIAIYVAIFSIKEERVHFLLKLFLAIMTLLYFAMNLTFVDRTRPTWIFFVCALSFFLSRDARELRIAKVFYAIMGPILFFFAFALISGKYTEDEGIVNNFVHYVIGGFSYLDSMISNDSARNYSAVKTFLPLSKTLEYFGLIEGVPSEVLDFRPVPFLTNVGTFLEPLYADGGIWMVLIFLPIMVFSLDGFALSLFRMQTVMSRFIWSNIVFTFVIGFFVPKYNSTAAYVFLAVFLLDWLIRLPHRRTRSH